uniref:Uncharacterized protein n=1 Tax=Heterorhabditis bacteriophora TaxID=37862 RepID=A0A1I7X348_HETBA
MKLFECKRDEGINVTEDLIYINSYNEILALSRICDVRKESISMFRPKQNKL